MWPFTRRAKEPVAAPEYMEELNSAKADREKLQNEVHEMMARLKREHDEEVRDMMNDWFEGKVR